ncbi:MAG: hypothetical protein K8I27_15430 [Planctomycetes bacterium]|nr:hypothetical protein [Planctomycetota bacterium]
MPEHRLANAVICLVCQQTIQDPYLYKCEPEKQIELAIKLKGRLVSEFGTTKLEEIKSKADEYTGRFEPVDDDDDELGDDTGTKTRTKTRTDLPEGRASTALMFDSGLYAAAPRRSGLSTAAKTYVIGGVLLAALTTIVVIVGLTILTDDQPEISEIQASGGEGERFERHPSGGVKTKWNVILVDGLEREDGAWQEFYPGGKQKTLGNYTKGERIGTWTGWHENGQKSFEVAYENGNEHGQMIEWHANGRKAAEGAYVRGVKDGEWRAWHPDGRTAAFARYEDGKPIGEWIEWYPDGQRKSHGLYQNGLKEGRWVYLRDNGSIELEELWLNGTLHGATSGQHRDRGKSFEGQWDKGLRAGTWSWWHVNGEFQRRGEYEDGKEAGFWQTWHPNGLLKEKGNYDTGRRSGTWEEFDEEGDLIAWREFAGDVLKAEQLFFHDSKVRRQTQMDGDKLKCEWTVLFDDDATKHGHETRFHANGQKAESGPWVMGKRHGKWQTWDDQGDLTSTTMWEDGRRVE